LGFLILPLLRAAAWALYLLPSGARELFAVALGRALRLSKLRLRVVEENLRYAYPGDLARRTELAGEAYSHLGRLVAEILMLFGPMRRYTERFSELRGKEHWDRARAQGKGVLFLASHVGNWEVMAASGAISGMDLMLVTKHLKPEWLHQAIRQGRLSCGVAATYEPRTLKDVLSQLKRGGTVGFVLDQYAGPPVGVRVPVFGQPVGTSTALATLAKRTGAAVLPVVSFRDGGRLVVQIEAPLPWQPDPDPARELAGNTALYAAKIEEHIRAHPEQWLWTHRRFKGDLTPLRADEWSQGRPRA
jgi:KDO2-lipid IV(A) lauroyltransferase